MSAVDIVISTYNRPDALRRCLAALARQTLRHFHVIVVDDCSDEPVEPVIRSARASGLDITYVRTPVNGGPARGRNLGAAHGTAPILLFLDDDVEAERGLVERHVAAGGAGVVAIGPLAAPPDWKPSPWTAWEARTLAREYDRMLAGVYAPTWRQFFTGNASMHRVDFKAAGGFDERFTRAEDIELGLRLARVGCRFVFIPRAVGWHHASRTLAGWKSIPAQYARFDVTIDRLYPDLGWLDLLREERRGRRAIGRWGRFACGVLRLEAAAAATAIVAARAWYRVGLAAPAMAGLSFAYELLYAGALRVVQDDSPDAGLPVRPLYRGLPGA